MKKARRYILLPVAAMLLCSGSSLFAQTGAASTNGSHGTDINHPGPWKPIMEKDILWKKRVWREIDANEARNMCFRYSEDPSYSARLIQVLMEAVENRVITAYDPVDDRFTKQMTHEEFMAMQEPRTIKEKTINAETGEIISNDVVMPFEKGMVYKYRLKEDWLFDKTTNKMTIRIVGLAPLMAVVSDSGTVSMEPMFWLFYPDLRNLLARSNVYFTGGSGNLTWDDVFEKRMFSSHVIKISAPKKEQGVIWNGKQ